MSEPEQRRTMFEAIVLQGIWCLILLGFGRRPRNQALNFRSAAIHYMDEFGNQSDAAREYRRETAYPDLNP